MTEQVILKLFAALFTNLVQKVTDVTFASLENDCYELVELLKTDDASIILNVIWYGAEHVPDEAIAGHNAWNDEHARAIVAEKVEAIMRNVVSDLLRKLQYAELEKQIK